MVMRDVYIVDDDAAVRESLSVLFNAQGYTPHVFSNGEAFLETDLQSLKGPILLDVRMPGRDGLDILSIALKENPNLAIIIMSGHGDIPMAVRALKYGARSFVEKPFKLADILEEFSNIETHLQTQEALNAERTDVLERLSGLTPRETEIMDHLVDGKPNKIIADDLNISVRTVEAHRARLHLKLGIKSLSDLVRLSLIAKQNPFN